MKKYFVAIAAVVMSLVMTAPAAHAVVRDYVACTYGTGPGSAWASGYVDVSYKVTGDGLRVEGVINDSVDSRTWNWKMKHDGSYSASGTHYGSGTIIRGMVDFPGTDVVTWIFENANNNVRCVAEVSIG